MSNFLADLRVRFPDQSTLTSGDVYKVFGMPHLNWMRANLVKVRNGVYRLPEGDIAERAKPAKAAKSVVEQPNNVVEMTSKKVIKRGASSGDRTDDQTPDKNPSFIPYGNFAVLRKIVSSGKFMPVFISGRSGYGKTEMILEACARANRECFRFNFTNRSDEFDLIGETGIVDGDTVFQEGVVISAMRRGGVLLLDEVDYASPEGFTALQSIMEGKPYLIKRTGETVRPAAGFTVIATANTKGQGDDSGRYYGAQLLNEAFLERFPITMDHEAPPVDIEQQILNAIAEVQGIQVTSGFINRLAVWAKANRDTEAKGGIAVSVSTRRLIHILRTFDIVSDENKAIALCIARFDKEVADALLMLWKSLSAAQGSPADVQSSTPSF